MPSPRPSRRRSPPPVLGPQTATVEESIVLALFDLANHVNRRGDRLAAVAGLTTQQWLVLLQIGGDPNFPSGGGARPGGVLPSEIARARGITRASVSAVVTALLRRGLIDETADAADGRRRRLSLTAAGVAALASVQPARVAANQRLLAQLDARERARFLRHLRLCLDALWDVHEDEQLTAARGRLARRSARRRA